MEGHFYGYKLVQNANMCQGCYGTVTVMANDVFLWVFKFS